MRKTTRLVVVAIGLMATSMLGTAASSARQRVEVAPAEFRLTASRLTFGGETGDIICDVTLLGHFTALRLISKVRGSRMGFLDGNTVRNCTSNFGSGAFAEFLTVTSPLLLYGSITGTLPTISGMLFELSIGFLKSVDTILGTIACLFIGTVGLGGANPIRTLSVLSNRWSLGRTLSGECSGAHEMAGTFTMTPSQTIRLLER